MSKIKVFKTRIYASEEIYHQFRKGFGTRRWCWNRAIDLYFNQNNKLSNFKMDVLLNSLIKDQPEEYCRIKEVNTMIKQNALKDLGLAINRYNKLQKKAKTSVSTEDDEKAIKGKPSIV